MAVAIPSDLIVDVMRNADPARMSSATAKLQSMRDGEAISQDFAGLLGRVAGNDSGLGVAIGSAASALPGRLPNQSGDSTPEAYVDFERMVLRNLLESLLPASESGAYGTGPSAGIWRSLAADQFAGLFASSGGIGIAETLSAGGDHDGSSDGGWPYFATDKIEAFSG